MWRPRCRRIVVFLALAWLLLVGGCGRSRPSAEQSPSRILRLATTSSATDSGLLDVLIPAFEKQHKIIADYGRVEFGDGLFTPLVVP